MVQLAHTANTFVVKLWRDRADGKWQGQITHLQTGVRRRFTTLVELEELLEEHAPGLSAPQAEPQPGAGSTSTDELSGNTGNQMV